MKCVWCRHIWGHLTKLTPPPSLSPGQLCGRRLVDERPVWGPCHWWLPCGAALHLQPPTAFPAFLAAGAVASGPWPGSHRSVPLHQSDGGLGLWARAPSGPAVPTGGEPTGARCFTTHQQCHPAGQRALLLPGGGAGPGTCQLWGQDGDPAEGGGSGFFCLCFEY